VDTKERVDAKPQDRARYQKHEERLYQIKPALAPHPLNRWRGVSHIGPTTSAEN
jgi:hypothetical protein